MSALLKWCAFCVVTGREPRLDLDTRRYFEIGDREDLSYAEKLAAYRALADEYFEVDRYRDFCDSRLPHVDELVLDWISSADFDRLLVDTVRSTYPAARARALPRPLPRPHRPVDQGARRDRHALLGLRVDRHVRGAEPRERLAPPAAVAALEPHPGQARHQVQLGGPRVPHLDRARLDPAVGEVVVLAAQPLRGRVVDVVGHATRVRPPRQHGLAERQPLQLRHPRLDHEPPAALQMRGGVREARDLAVLRVQVEDRVEDEVDDRELAVDARRRHVPDMAATRSAPGFSRSRASISFELSIPATRTPRSASGSAIRPVPIANSSAAPSPASSASSSTAGATTSGSNIPAESSS